MTAPRFLQIHTLHSYTAALLNRDDTGQAKRLQYGGTSRTRISSQCLKRHWRKAEKDPYALHRIDGYIESIRSRNLVDEIFRPLELLPEVQEAIRPWLNWVIYSGNKKDVPKKLGEESKADDQRKRPTLLFGQVELNWFTAEVQKIDKQSDQNVERAFQLMKDWVGINEKASNGKKKEKSEDDGEEVGLGYKKKIGALRQENFAALRSTVAVGATNTQEAEAKSSYAGLAAAMFGRMVTSDPAANIDAPIYVSHAFTVHKEETEGDYFTAVDDLKKDEDDGGADTIQETELTSGLFYGYVVVDMPGLVKNCGGDDELASRVLHNLVHLIAEVSPGAKRGSTAPFGRADLMLLEAGDRQPRSLATAYRDAIDHDPNLAVTRLGEELRTFDETYATGENRAYLSLRGELQGIEKLNLPNLANWGATRVKEAPKEKPDV